MDLLQQMLDRGLEMPRRNQVKPHPCRCMLIVPGSLARDHCMVMVDNPDQPLCDHCTREGHQDAKEFRLCGGDGKPGCCRDRT